MLRLCWHKIYFIIKYFQQNYFRYLVREKIIGDEIPSLANNISATFTGFWPYWPYFSQFHRNLGTFARIQQLFLSKSSRWIPTLIKFWPVLLESGGSRRRSNTNIWGPLTINSGYQQTPMPDCNGFSQTCL